MGSILLPGLLLSPLTVRGLPSPHLPGAHVYAWMGSVQLILRGLLLSPLTVRPAPLTVCLTCCPPIRCLYEAWMGSYYGDSAKVRVAFPGEG